MMGGAIDLLIFLNVDTIRIIPYPPSFNRIAARIIEPATGASTCAFGSHKCTINIGSLTKNAVIVSIHRVDAI